MELSLRKEGTAVGGRWAMVAAVERMRASFSWEGEEYRSEAWGMEERKRATEALAVEDEGRGQCAMSDENWARLGFVHRTDTSSASGN